MARRHPTLRDLEGAGPSLRFAIGMARHLARREARRMGRERRLPPEDPQDPPPTPDPGLGAAIRECMDRLSDKLRRVLQARITYGPFQADREIAPRLGMKLNTFLQNIVRSRQKIRKCLEGKGVPLSEIPS